MFARDRAADPAGAVARCATPPATSTSTTSRPARSSGSSRSAARARSGTNDKAGSKLNLVRWASARTVKETLAPPRDHKAPVHGGRVGMALNVRDGEPPVLRTVHLGGRLTNETVATLDAELEKIAGSSATVVVFDLAELDYISSVGLRSIFRTQKAMVARGGKALLAILSHRSRRLLKQRQRCGSLGGLQQRSRARPHSTRCSARWSASSARSSQQTALPTLTTPWIFPVASRVRPPRTSSQEKQSVGRSLTLGAVDARSSAHFEVTMIHDADVPRETPDGPSPEEVEYLIRTNSASSPRAKQKACWWPSTA